jgi:hypothetical protein
MRQLKIVIASGLLIGSLSGGQNALAETEKSSQSAAEAPIAAVWVPHEVSFSYMGFTSYYSCDGLETKLKLLLKVSGARPDFKVAASCSDMTGGPSRLSSARLRFHTLAVQAPADVQEALQPGLGEWRAVSLRNRLPSGLTEGDCELVEQFQRELLPLFTVRDQVSQMTCIPHQRSFGGLRLQYSVLAPIPEPKTP